ncbi:MAG: sulfatase-like hydrolase/transferase [bacterium]|nr:sulfatase-like hydrolase/transferase [bacterium]
MLRRPACFLSTLLFLLTSCSPSGSSGPPALLLISLDTTRSDHLSAYGYPRPTSPALETLAERGVRFTSAYSASASTGPSHATLFTSLHPARHGVLKNGLSLADGRETLAERLKGEGFQTAAVVSSFVLNAKFGLAQGFDHYDDAFAPEEATATLAEWEGHAVPGSFDRRGDHTTEHALRWLREERDPTLPFFLFVHYFDPHLPYTPPEPFDSRFVEKLPASAGQLEKVVARYDGELAFVDNAVGTLLRGLEDLGLDDATLVIVTGDHGEGLMKHGMLGHAVHLYEESVRVPLLMRWPGRLPRGHSVSGPVAAIDIAPTALELLGIEPPRGLEGESLALAARGEADLDPERPIYLHRRTYDSAWVADMGRLYVNGSQSGIRQGRWKYIEGDLLKTRELFDLEADRGEQRNLASSRPEKARELASRLEERRRQHDADPNEAPLSPEDREALEALGYVE